MIKTLVIKNIFLLNIIINITLIILKKLNIFREIIKYLIFNIEGCIT